MKIAIRVRRRPIVGLVLTALAAAALTTGPVRPSSAAAPATHPTVQLNRPQEVTLLTGDRIRLSGGGAGPYSFDVTPAPRDGGSPPSFVGNAGPDGFYVYPVDALPAVQSGLLDRELFDVKYLVENGYADSSTDQLPLIVQYPETRTAESVGALADALPASNVSVALPSIHSSGVHVTKKDAAAFWSTIRTTTASKILGGGIAKIWLDRKVKASLDKSVPLIGAPAAWAKGLDGSGVTVAVLDTGVDTGHPDLAGRIAQTKSFVPDVTSVQDGNGHGTHVASTVAGDGAASGGRYRGVAPGAKLAVGKVLTDDGIGDDSWIIAGMQWAAQSGAKVISMSLGGEPTDGSDPLSQAVDDLTASTGALFVVAAGNSGPTGGTIATPGAASAALTVSATDKTDKLPGFSSRGPRLGDDALKPDLAAPGVDIVAARAAGTSEGVPVDDNYTSLSGTSMATPHVAGAVAILAQQHPDWSPARLKAALMSTSKDDGFTVYEQGAGRVDVARAVSQQVGSLTPNLDFGLVPDGAGAMSRQLSYVNDGDQDVVLRLQLAAHATIGRHSATSAFQLARTVTVPAHSHVRTAVSFDPRRLTPATYTGAVVATNVASGTRLTTPIGLVRQAPLVTLSIRTLDRDGKQSDGITSENHGYEVLDVGGDTGALSPSQIQLIEPGLAQAQVPAGTYEVATEFYWSGASYRANFADLLQPEVVVSGDTTVTLDARQAQLESVSTPIPSEESPTAWLLDFNQRTTADGTIYATFSNRRPGTRVYESPTHRVRTGGLLSSFARVLGAPEATMTVNGQRPVALHPGIMPHDRDVPDGSTPGQGPSDYVSFEGTRTLPVVDVGSGSAEEIEGRDLHGKLVLVDDGGRYLMTILTVIRLREAGVAGILAWAAGPPGAGMPLPISMVDSDLQTAEIGVPYVSLHPTEGRALRAELQHEAATITVHGTPQSPYLYQVAPLFRDRITAPSTTVKTDQLVRIDTEYHATGGTDGLWKANAGTVTSKQLVELNPSAPVRPGPGTRTEYVGPVQAGAVTIRSVSDAVSGANEARIEVVDRATRRTERWNAQPLTAGAVVAPAAAYGLFDPLAPAGTESAFAYCMMCRQGDTLWPIVTHSSADGRFSGNWAPAPRLYRNGQEIEYHPGFVPSFHLDSGPADYRLVAEDSVTRTTTEWNYRSSPVTRPGAAGGTLCPGLIFGWTAPCRPEPLVYVGFDLGASIGLDNTVRSGRPHSFTATAYHAPSVARMPAISGLRVWTSTDDGGHWIPAKVGRGRQGTYTVTAQYAAGAGAVSLKVQASDAAGSTVEQTTLRAFDLRG
ncbi:S8 family serine peptidase [Kribbella sp. NPDC051586]|uniref:S8 family serine peptidase n=1 Tax=Kribbella sp. NPDC051586 TaxID=3364118 RepID=UPI00378C3239